MVRGITMRYCNECGEKLLDHYEHCPECGTKINSTATYEDTPLPAVQFKRNVDWQVLGKSLWPSIQRHKWIYIGVAAALIILFGLFETGKYITDPDRLVAKLETALHRKDTSALSSLLQVEGDKMNLNDDNLNPLIRYLNSDPSVLDRLITDLKSQINHDEEQVMAEDMDGSFYDNFINVRKVGKKFMLYDNYVLEISTYYTDVYTNYEGATIYVNEKEVAQADGSDFSTEIGPLLPGLYTFKSEYVGEYTSLQNEQTTVLSNRNNDYALDLSLSGRYFIVESNYNDAAIYVDGKDIGALIADNREMGLFQWMVPMKCMLRDSFLGALSKVIVTR